MVDFHELCSEYLSEMEEYEEAVVDQLKAINYVKDLKSRFLKTQEDYFAELMKASELIYYLTSDCDKKMELTKRMSSQILENREFLSNLEKQSLDNDPVVKKFLNGRELG